MKPIIQAKVVIVGEQGVGKTALVVRYTKGVFERDSVSTIGAAYFTKELKFDNNKVNLHIWDTAGQERFKSMMPMYYRNTSAALLVFDITLPATFSAVKVWARDLSLNAASDLVLYLVGCKVDMKRERRVTSEEGARHADSISAHYWEVSSLNNEGVMELFEDLAKQVLKRHIKTMNKTETKNINNIYYYEKPSNAPVLTNKKNLAREMQNESCC